MSKRDLVVVGASAGGIEALRALVPALPAGLDATVLVVVHLPAHAPSRLAALLDAHSALPTAPAEDGAPLVRGRIYVGPPGMHLTVDRERMRLDAGPRENGFRPAIDRLFRSAAAMRGPRVIGVVLSGTLDDGTQGLAAIKRRHGLAYAQDPSEATFSAMPRSAVENVALDGALPVVALAAEIARRVGEEVAVAPEAGAENDFERRDVERVRRTVVGPDCGGVMREIADGAMRRIGTTARRKTRASRPKAAATARGR